jgi:hypothetical protein
MLIKAKAKIVVLRIYQGIESTHPFKILAMDDPTMGRNNTFLVNLLVVGLIPGNLI